MSDPLFNSDKISLTPVIATSMKRRSVLEKEGQSRQTPEEDIDRESDDLTASSQRTTTFPCATHSENNIPIDGGNPDDIRNDDTNSADYGSGDTSDVSIVNEGENNDNLTQVTTSKDANGLRRSSRVRQPPKRLTVPEPSRKQCKESLDCEEGETHRLEQIDCISPRDYGLPEEHPSRRLRVIVDPVAMALISFHAHLTRTEVIGYLGGGVQYNSTGDIEVLIAEAFPAEAVGEQALAKSGRSAFAEVEIDPESSVEVMTRVVKKKLEVVGWYHSHPDASFSVEPSRVDIENQHNYQQFIFKESPFVAAIIAPYSAQPPDHMPEIRFFQTHNQDTPLKLPYSVGVLDLNVLSGHGVGDHHCPANDFIIESLALVAAHSESPKRVRLDRDWHDNVNGVSKLRCALVDIVNHVNAGDETIWNLKEDSNHSNKPYKKHYLDSVQLIMDTVERRWKERGQLDDEKRERNRVAAVRRKKRSRIR